MIKHPVHTKIYSQPYYTEGPVIDEAGHLFFTTLTGGTIMKVSPGTVPIVWARSSCPNGQVILPNGHHLVCDSQASALVRFDADGAFVQNDIQGYCGGEPVLVPNDVITDGEGNVYFTDSVRHTGTVGFIGADGTQKIIAKNLDYPNGLALANDGQTLFVAESYQNRILAFELEAAGVVRSRSVLANLPQHPSNEMVNNLPDGIKVDADDHLWVAHYGMGCIHRLSPEGLLCQSIEVPFQLPSNLFLKNNTLTVTGGYGEPGPGGVFEIELSYD